MTKRTLGFTLFMLVCLNLPLPVTADIINIPEPVPPTFAVREAFALDPFYQQWIDVEGLPVVASAKVNPYAVKEAAWLIYQMIGHRPDVLRAMAQNNARFAVMAYDEMTTDIPEHSDLRPDFYWDRRARGLGATPARPAVSCGEENLLNYLGDPYWNENILIHEFSHAIHEMGLNTTNPGFDSRLKSTFETAMRKGLWAGTYASSNKQEYWAEGAQSWFNTNREHGAHHNHVNTRTELKNYDTALATLLREVFGDTDWRYTQVTMRRNLPHLQGFDPQDAPTFEWPPDLLYQLQQLRDPDSDGNGQWVNLKRYDPSELSRLKSRNGARTEIIFVNNSVAEFFFYWVDGDGKERYVGRVDAGRYSQRWTYAGHIWLIKDQNGKNLAVFQAEEKTGRAYIGKPQPQPQRITQVSGNNQHGLVNTQLDNPFVVEVRDQYNNPLPDAHVTFSVTAGRGMLSVTSTTTDLNGRAESTITLGNDPVTHTVAVSVEGIAETVTFHAVAELLEFDLALPSGISLIHVPLKVRMVNGVAGTIESVGDLYDALGSAGVVNFLITYDSQAQEWRSFFVSSDKGTPADAAFTDDTGIIAGLKVPASVQLSGDPLGIDGNSTISLKQGLNVVGLPLRDSRISRVSDFLILEGISGNVPVVILTDEGEFKLVGRAGDPGDIAITGGQAFIMTAQRAAIVTISGDAWTNTPTAVD